MKGKEYFQIRDQSLFVAGVIQLKGWGGGVKNILRLGEWALKTKDKSRVGEEKVSL